eukprot:8167137-Ditylum_brightwellii.AAC.2
MEAQYIVFSSAVREVLSSRSPIGEIDPVMIIAVTKPSIKYTVIKVNKGVPNNRPRENHIVQKYCHFRSAVKEMI